MSWREEVFGPMRERNLENAQVRLLATEYDLARDSRLARAIARQVNQELETAERRLGIVRIQPGELVLRTCRGELILPLRTPADLDRAMAGERLETIRADIIGRCLARYRALFPDAGRWEEERLLRCLQLNRSAIRDGGRAHGILQPARQRPYGPVDGELAAALIRDGEKAAESRPAENPRWPEEEVRLRLSHFLAVEAGVPPAVREPLLLDLARLRARFCPRLGQVGSGQMLHVAMHVQSGRRLDQPTRWQPLAPVLLTLVTAREMRELAGRFRWPYPELMALHARRMARVMVEAYRQDGLLSQAELQWCFLTSTGTISRVLDWYQRQHQVILPCPGSVLDMGRMLTHKDIIVRLHLEGWSVLEISGKTCHAPRSVDAYLKMFDAVLILRLYGLPAPLMARVLGRGVSLVEEYLRLMEEHLVEVKSMRAYLQSRGVKLPGIESGR